MSIPLEKLYNHLNDISDRDILIYRWSPHGSKKIEDLIILTASGDQYRQQSNTWVDSMITPAMICHDQEPLDYESYSPAQIEYYYNQRYCVSPHYQSSHYKNIITNMNLRSALITPLTVYDRILLCHSEQNSPELKKYEDHGFVGVYYWSHAVIARDWFRYAEHDLQLAPVLSELQHDFLIYNRAWSGTREYRLKFAEMLVERSLVKHCATSFSTVDNNTHYASHQYRNQNFKVDRCDLENFFPANTSSSNASADYVAADYKSAGMEVVLETLFDDQRNHLTEKILRPIACGKPFILAATPNSLKYLKNYGFKTFGQYIDESYDSINDPLHRLTAVVNEMQRISMLPANEKTQLWKSLHEIALYNKKLFFSSQWENSILQEYVQNLKHGLENLEKYKTGFYWNKVFDPVLADQVIVNNPKNAQGLRMDQWIVDNLRQGV